METRLCPKCGKPMSQQIGWPGLWICPDYKPINTKPPFRFRCTGSEVTDEAVEVFDRACMKIVAERN